jgi:hypothetical protein
VVSGCATTEGNQQLMGAAGGATLGCIARLLLGGGDSEDCAKGAAAGAALGWAAVKVSQYQASKVRSEKQDRRVYGLTKPLNTALVKIRNGTASPDTVGPGQQVKVVTDYSLMVPKGASGAEVEETWVIKKDGKQLAAPATNRVWREAGGYAVDATIPIPANAKPGTYVIETRVESGTSYDIEQSVFVVES